MKQLTLTLSLLLLTVTLFAQPSCPPHPLFSALANHSTRNCEEKDFDKLELRQSKTGGGTTSLEKQGHFFQLVYKFDGEWEKRPSTTQIMQNYANAVKKSGGDILYQSEGRLDAKIKKTDAVYWMTVTSDGSGDYWVRTVREEAMKQDVTDISAAEIKKGIDEEGRIAFYGIYFDTDKAILKPESGNALAEIAKYLKENAAVNVFIVGHTDNTGDFNHNNSLSKARAEAVVNELVSKYQVEKTRLTAQGVGPLSPVAANKTEEGKAKNRRVEMVQSNPPR
jgi:outer membrane protein OmpA-like peptidoglycan-associated protein